MGGAILEVGQLQRHQGSSHLDWPTDVLPLPKNRRLSADTDNLHALCRLLETQKLISRSIAGELNGAQHEEGRVQKPCEPASSGAFVTLLSFQNECLDFFFGRLLLNDQEF